MLQVENLKISFMISNGEVQTVRGASLEVHRGEIVSIIDEPNPGKSITNMTLLKLLPDTAVIKDGRAMSQDQDLMKLSMRGLREIHGEKIAMIPQDPMFSLNPLIPAGERVTEIIRVHHSDRSREAMKQEVLKRFVEVRIPEPEKRYRVYPYEFSGGTQRCAMIATTLVNSPEPLIANEPATVLDVTIQGRIIRQMRELKEQRGISIIFIIHDLGVIAELYEKARTMYGGLITEEAPIDEFFEYLSHPYILGLLESVSSIQQGKAECLTPIPGSSSDVINPPAGHSFAPRCRYARKICVAELPEL